MTPARIRLSRAAGWRKPAGAIVVARPGMFGNPFDARDLGRAEAVLRHRLWLTGIGPDTHIVNGVAYNRRLVHRRIGELAGRTLCCWCPLDGPCHAETLIKLAEETRP